MSNEAFDHLCALRDSLVALGLDSLLDAIADGDEETVEAALEALCSVA